MEMYKEDLALNAFQWLISHKIQPNQTNQIETRFFHLVSLFGQIDIKNYKMPELK